MPSGLAHVWRLMRAGRVLARHDALMTPAQLAEHMRERPVGTTAAQMREAADYLDQHAELVEALRDARKVISGSSTWPSTPSVDLVL